MVEVGDAAPEFCLTADNEQEVCLNAYRGKWVVLYFYPKDNTSGCTREAEDFTAALDALHTLGADVGISGQILQDQKKDYRDRIKALSAFT